MASIGMRSLEIGSQPPGYAGGDAFHYPLLRMLVAARAHGLQAIDGPYAAIHDTDGLARAASSVAALGFDGKWVLHPGQIETVNAAFSPGQAEYDQAELILEAYQHYTTVEKRGAAMLNGEMIDAASRKLAQVAAAQARAAWWPGQNAALRASGLTWSRGHLRRRSRSARAVRPRRPAPRSGRWSASPAPPSGPSRPESPSGHRRHRRQR